jgi:hypothetical protein
MSQLDQSRLTRPPRAALWLGVAGLLLAWNSLTALYANPFTLTQRYDGVQYQLLARNRLNGHDEVGDTAHTVRREGQHPMWRPGLVWIEQELGAALGSVRTGAALASALGTTVLELAMLWLALLCFGIRTGLVVLLAIFLPWPVGAFFLSLAIGQGPEPWAAAAIVIGLASLVAAVRWRSWIWALNAGLAAGLAEWFRTGTTLLFAAPWAVYGLTFLWRRTWLQLGLAGAAAAGLLITTTLAGNLVHSAVNKTAANFGHNLAEIDGPFLTEEVKNVGVVTFSMGGYRIVPGTNETYNDYIIRHSRESSGTDLLAECAEVIIPLYVERLGQAVASGLWGLRWLLGEAVLACIALQVVRGITRRDKESLPSLAFAAGGLAYYFGPVVLLRGDAPSHYLLLALPLFVLVSARGAVGLAEIIGSYCQRRLPGLVQWARLRRVFLAVVGTAPLLCLAGHFYFTVLSTLRDYQGRAEAAQAAIDSLRLEGKTVACRNMSWFVDRDVTTILFPFAAVPELETYARARNVDGILVWDDETQLYFRATPYGSLDDFDRAMRKSSVFAPPQVAGAWRWYPVRSPRM